jgi:hypothetical protein
MISQPEEEDAMRIQRGHPRVAGGLQCGYKFTRWALCVVLLGATAAAIGQSAPSDEAQIKSRLAQYRQSIDTLNLALFTDLWSNEAPVSFIHPLGTDHGLDQIKADIFERVMALFSKRDLAFDSTAIHVYGDSAWVEITWTFHAVWKSNDAALTSTGRETQIYQKEHGVWHLVHVHYSGPPMEIPSSGV